ncbi:hypothetical protein BG844_11620 [Couchioplanes caeruleus subsp. caeruleus]|uniref:Uncharacterized protein n=1 Tax=Couchioplanes caeruleus subsp. caeruleus TaxID=56427 RepID=A0A1K0GS93_9ACTN|nr:hypothetical protein BG844_11620 [Couchioplanes caeruleus subsp. caeruleus]
MELAGILGALLAIPVAGILQILARDIWDTRRGRPKTEPTVGEDRTPVTEAPAERDIEAAATAGASDTRVAYGRNTMAEPAAPRRRI